jgi:hypothetical protein
MSSSTTPTTEPSAESTKGRGRGSHKSRGGLGKYLRARGRGRGRGRGAVFNERLVLEGEVTLNDEEAAELAAENRAKYRRRELGDNADRYNEEVALGSDGELIAPLACASRCQFTIPNR